MPWKSLAQAAYMHIHHPEIAKEFDDSTPPNSHLPKHVKKKKPARRRGLAGSIVEESKDS